jgi:hypothetical protein
LFHQFLEAMVGRDGFLELGDLFPGNIVGNIPAVFVTLVIAIVPLRALADDAEGSSVQALDLGELAEYGLGSGGIYYEWYLLYAYTQATKQGETPLSPKTEVGRERTQRTQRTQRQTGGS